LPIKERGDREEGAQSAEEEKRQQENKMSEELKDEIQKRSKKSMADGRGIEVLVTAIREHYGGVVVVERACRALAQLAFNSWENAHKICGEEGPRVIARAMLMQMANAHVLEQACALLKNLFSSYSDAPKSECWVCVCACLCMHERLLCAVVCTVCLDVRFICICIHTCIHKHKTYIHTYIHTRMDAAHIRNQFPLAKASTNSHARVRACTELHANTHTHKKHPC
jgi:hypothetical protein